MKIGTFSEYLTFEIGNNSEFSMEEIGTFSGCCKLFGWGGFAGIGFFGIFVLPQFAWVPGTVYGRYGGIA